MIGEVHWLGDETPMVCGAMWGILKSCRYGQWTSPVTESAVFRAPDVVNPPLRCTSIAAGVLPSQSTDYRVSAAAYSLKVL